MQNQKKCEAPVRTGLPPRGRSARNARVFSVARRQDRAGCVMLHCGSVGNTLRRNVLLLQQLKSVIKS